MRNKNILLCILAVSLITIIGCKKSDWYDVKSNATLAVPSTLTDFQALMDDVGTLNRYSPGLGEVASDGHYVIPSMISSLDNNSFNAYTWSKTFPYKTVIEWTGNSFLVGCYPKIFSCNLVLEGLNKITPSTTIEQLEWQNLQGQALFHRAKAFFELAQIWAPQYSQSTKSSLSIPLRLSSDFNVPSVRSTVEQTYAQVIGDLESSLNLLPLTPKFKTRPSKHAAFAMLARIYLIMQNYDKAGAFADSCLSLNNSLINYSTLNPAASAPVQRFNTEVVFHSEMAFYYGFYPGVYSFIDASLYGMYDVNDLRRDIFFSKNISTNEITFKGSYVGSAFLFFNGLANDELMLIRAESFARAGNLTKALKDLNDLLRTRFKPATYIDATSNNKDQILGWILDERKKELLLRGLRWSDLRRLNLEDQYKVTLSRNVNGTTYTLEPNSYKYTFPIPDDIMQYNPSWQQNPGW